jgi:type II secretory pathway component GspD/PulD (secretin)
LFPDTNKGTDETQEEIRFGGPPPEGAPEMRGVDAGSGLDGSSGGTTRSKKRNQVAAVADPRTSSVLVSAGGTLMTQIAKLIEQLDESPARKESVAMYDLHNADPHEVNQVLQDLFNRNQASRNNANRASLLGDNNPLTTRQTRQTTVTTLSAQSANAGAGSGAQGGTQGSAQGGF